MTQSDGRWEHQNGIHIETLDNPGWIVTIDLQDTRYSAVANVAIVEQVFGESDWLICRVIAGKFEGQGDPRKLLPILERFRSWIEND